MVVLFLIVLVSTNHHLKETCDKTSDCISLKSDLENSHAAEVGLWSQVSLPLPLQIPQVHIRIYTSYI